MSTNAPLRTEKSLTGALSVVRKTTLDIMLRLKDRERENGALHQTIANLQAAYFSVEHSLSHSQEMCVMLEARIHQMQDEGIVSWNEQMSELKASLQEQAQKVANLQLANSQLQSALQTKDENISTLRSILQQKSDEVCFASVPQYSYNN